MNYFGSLFLLGIVVTVFGQKANCPKEPKGIEFDALQKELNAKEVILIDVRSCKEIREDGFIPGSYHLPMHAVYDTFRTRKFEAKKLLAKNGANIVISCQGGVRATRAYHSIGVSGYCDARVYFGSFADWKQRGGAIDKVTSVTKYSKYCDKENGNSGGTSAARLSSLL